ncbi:MAG: hypothetical protein PHU98_06175 [Mariniphaga sp.]|nr:hypothetical protein [Paludibacter sp.]MDD4225957.1 hypothetical protein [Mariniphaga sp.]
MKKIIFVISFLLLSTFSCFSQPWLLSRYHRQFWKGDTARTIINPTYNIMDGNQPLHFWYDSIYFDRLKPTSGTGFAPLGIDRATGRMDTIQSATRFYTIKWTVTHNQILYSYDTARLVIAAPGTGKYIQLLAVQSKGNGGGGFVAYTGNTTADFILSTAIAAQLTDNASLPIASEVWNSLIFSSAADCIVENKALMWQIQTGNPTGGAPGQTIDYYITYMIVNL